MGRQGRWGESFPLFAAAANRGDELLRRFPEETDALKLQQAHVLNVWGNSYLNMSDWKMAVEKYELARTIYRGLSYEVREGYAETLTNLALALTKLGNLTAAELALKEALSVAHETENYDQISRIKIALIQMGSSLVPASEREKTLLDAIELSQKLGRIPTAYLRCCIGAQVCAESVAPEEGVAVR